MTLHEQRIQIINVENDIDDKKNNEKYADDIVALDDVGKKKDYVFDENGNIDQTSDKERKDVTKKGGDIEMEEKNHTTLNGVEAQKTDATDVVGKGNKYKLLYECDHIDEEDYDTDLENDESIMKSYIDEQKEKYVNRCKRFGIPPVKIVLNGLTKQKLKLSHQGLGSIGLKAIVPTLKTNTFVTELDLRDNNIEEEGTRLLAKALSDNLFIKHLDISMNNMNNSGFEELLESLTINKSVQHLNMSQTGLKDKHAGMISELIKENCVIKMFFLTGNEFAAAGGVVIGQALTINGIISHLDLSWNHIRYAGATAIGQALKLNSSLITINIAWNGFADNGAEAIAKALLTNNSIQELDLSYNRISDKGSTALADSLKVNRPLRILKMNWNTIRSDGVSALINGIEKNNHSKLEELQLNGVVINGVCKAEMDALLLKRLQLRIYIGGVTNSGAMSTNMNKIRREIVEIITTYLSKNRLRMLDLFNQWDKDKSLTLTRNEFRKGIKSCNIPISEIQLYFMLEWLDQDGNDEIEYNEFVAITEVQ